MRFYDVSILANSLATAGELREGVPDAGLKFIVGVLARGLVPETAKPICASVLNKLFPIK
jgi:hypothetical protein